MARSVVYKRHVEPIATDPDFYDKIQRNTNVAIKEEPPDDNTDQLQTKEYGIEEHISSLETDRNPNKENNCNQSVSEAKLTPKASANRGLKRKRLSETVMNDMSAKSSSDREVRQVRKSVGGVVTRRRTESTTSSSNVENTSTKLKVKCKLKLNVKDNSSNNSSKSSTECNVCFLKFSTQKVFRRHIVMFSKPKLTCETCKGLFFRLDRFTTHRATCKESSVGTLKKFAWYFLCDMCPRHFRKKTALQSHFFHAHGDVVTSNAIADGSVQHSENSNSDVQITEEPSTPCSVKSTPSKKLRQTTLTEFIRTSPGKAHVETAAPVKPDVEEQSQLAESSNQSKSSSSKKPFVTIHTKVDMMAELLQNTVRVKTEPSEICDVNDNGRIYSLRSKKSLNETFTLRDTNTRHNSNAESGSWKDHTYAKTKDHNTDVKMSSPRQHTTPKRTSARKSFVNQDVRVSDPNLAKVDTLEKVAPSEKFIHKCRNFTIDLVRCDYMLKSNTFGKSTNQFKVKQSDVIVVENNEQDTSTAACSSIPATNESVKVTDINISSPVIKLPKLEIQDDNIFKCKLCDKMFVSRKRRREHIKLDHTVYISSVCRARFSHKRQLLKHYLCYHAVFNRNRCCVCKELFLNRTMMKKHLSVHCLKVTRTNKDTLPVDADVRCLKFRKIHKCKACGKSFWLGSCLKQHENVCRLRTKASEPNSRQNDEVSTVTKQEPRVQNNAQSDVSMSNSFATEPASPTPTTDSGRTNMSEVTESSGINQLLNILEARRSEDQNSQIHNLVLYTPALSHSKQIYPCTVCGKQFQTMKNLTQHMRIYAGPITDRCDICGTAFPSRRHLLTHNNLAHVPQISMTYKFHCRYCNQGFSKKDRLRIHESHLHEHSTSAMFPEAIPINEDRQESQVNLPDLMCKVCHVTFQTRHRFEEHNKYYAKEAIHSCKLCQQDFQGMYILHRHIKLVHLSEHARSTYQFLCNICQEYFKHESHFLAHQMHVHSCTLTSLPDAIMQNSTSDASKATSDDITKYVSSDAHVCIVCKLDFKSVEELAIHKIEYSNNGSYTCNKCPRKFCTAEALDYHSILNHDNSVDGVYKCPTCKEVLINSVSLMCHELHFHEADRHPTPSTCITEKLSTLASRIVAEKDGLTANPASIPDATKTAPSENTASNKLACQLCDAAFSSRLELDLHLVEFSNAGRYTCDMCSGNFLEFSYLQKHKEKHGVLHTLLTEYRCSFCKKSFVSEGSLKMHTMHIHSRRVHVQEATGNPGSTDNKLPNAVPQRTNVNNVLLSTSSPSAMTDANKATVQNSNYSQAYDHVYSMPMSAADKTPFLQDSPNTVIINDQLNETVSATEESGETQNAIRCNVCFLKFTDVKNLTKHKMRYVDKGDYMCEFCGKQFQWKSVFLEHVLRHSSSEDSFKFACPYCDEKFRTPTCAHVHIAHTHGVSTRRRAYKVENSESQPKTNYVDVVDAESVYTDGYVGRKDDIEDQQRKRNSGVRDPKMQTENPSATCDNNLEDVRESNEAHTWDTALRKRFDLNILGFATKQTDKNVTATEQLKNLEEDLPYMCPVCLTGCTSLSQFCTHFQTHHFVKKSPGISKYQKVVDQLNDLHENMIQCIICDTVCDSEESLKEHLRVAHMPRQHVIKTDSSTNNSEREQDTNVLEIIYDKKKDKVIETFTIDDEDDIVEVDANEKSNEKSEPKLVIIDPPVKQCSSKSNVVVNAVKPTVIGKLKVKPFAKIIENLSQQSTSSQRNSEERVIRLVPLRYCTVDQLRSSQQSLECPTNTQSNVKKL